MLGTFKKMSLLALMLTSFNGYAADTNPVLRSFMKCEATDFSGRAAFELFSPFSVQESGQAQGQGIMIMDFMLPGGEHADRMAFTDVSINSMAVDCGGHGLSVDGTYKLSGTTGDYSVMFCQDGPRGHMTIDGLTVELKCALVLP